MAYGAGYALVGPPPIELPPALMVMPELSNPPGTTFPPTKSPVPRPDSPIDEPTDRIHFFIDDRAAPAGRERDTHRAGDCTEGITRQRRRKRGHGEVVNPESDQTSGDQFHHFHRLYCGAEKLRIFSPLLMRIRALVMMRTFGRRVTRSAGFAFCH